MIKNLIATIIVVPIALVILLVVAAGITTAALVLLPLRIYNDLTHRDKQRKAAENVRRNPDEL